MGPSLFVSASLLGGWSVIGCFRRREMKRATAVNVGGVSGDTSVAIAVAVTIAVTIAVIVRVWN